MYDYDVKYRKESEIDSAFQYLQELNIQITDLKHKIKEMKMKKKKKFFFKIFEKKVEKEERPKYTKYKKSKTFKKDGYEFYLRLNVRFNKTEKEPSYYEVLINITYCYETRKKEYYKTFLNYQDAIEHYNSWIGILKILKRRDIIEKIFKVKEQEILELQNEFNLK